MNRGLQTFGIWGLMVLASILALAVLGTPSQGAGMASVAFAWMPLAGVIYGRKIFDWSKINDIEHIDDKKEMIVDAANTFMQKINQQKVAGAKISGADPNLQGAIPVVLVMSDTVKNPDRGYELLFDEVDMRESTSDTFEVLDVSGGVTFYQQNPGEEAKMSKIPSSDKTNVGFLRFTGGLNILDDWLRFNKYYLIDELFEDTIRRWWGKKATLFYGLLSNLTGIDEPFDTDDVLTINNACASILTDLEKIGFDVDENEQFVITCNPRLRGRIFKAIASSFVNPNQNNNQIIYNISAVVSSTKVANTSYYVSLPGRKNKRGEWEDFNARPAQRDERILGAAHVWTGAYNGIIAQKKQHRRCALS
ncbi:MAG: hypothetical protein GXP46_01870 [Deferribacteres bacterium]|nr:hypothetical protein [Deferribacteres bacterium]